MRRPAPATIGILFAGALSLQAGASASELSSLLKKPVSPASIALLAPFSREPAVVERWREALGNPNPSVRAVAARAVTTCGPAALLSEVEAAVAVETDVGAAREEIRALALLGDERQRTAAVDAAERIGPTVHGDLVRALARSLGPLAFPLYFQRLQALHLHDTDRNAFFLLASGGGRGSLEAAASMALGRKDDVDWRAILSAAGKDSTLASSAVVRAGLASADGSLRGEAAWYLAGRYCEQPPNASGEVLEALRTGEAADSQSAVDPETAFGAELLRRVLGQPATESRDWILCLKTNERCHLDSDLERSPLYKYLTEGEREAIEERNRKNLPPELKSRSKSDSPPPIVGPVDSRLWAVGSLPEGLGEDFLKAASCGGRGRGRIGVAEIAFGTDGRPRTVTLLEAGPQVRGCEEILKAGFLLSLAPDNKPTSPKEPLLMETILLPEVLECLSEDKATSFLPQAGSDVFHVRGRIVPPKLTRRVEPFYPESSRQARVQGTAILEAVISPEGCVKGLHVVKSAATPLDVSAVAGVSQWKYEPAMLDGRPVSVYLTVTVQYRLK